MKKTMIYLPEEMHRYLARESSERDVSMAEVVREAISEYRTRRLADEPVSGIEALFGCIGDDDSLPADASMRVDELLAEYYAEGGEWDQEHGLANPPR